MRSQCRHHLLHAYERSQQTSLLRLRVPPSPLKRSCGKGGRRCYATATTEDAAQSRSLAIQSEARYNEIGVQHVSKHIHEQLFPPRSLNDSHAPPKPDAELVALSKKHLTDHELLGKTSDHTPPIAFDLPSLQGATLDEHFHNLGMESADTYLKLAKKYARASPPPKPRRWERQSGWTKYFPDGTSEPIAAPDADCLTFDVEVLWHETSFPAMACAVSGTHWYAWLSPWLLGESTSDRHLIPLGDPINEKIVVGHNVGYDRARIKEEYSLQQSKTFFMDTMSLHVAVNGMCSRQRPDWMKARKAREFQDRVSQEEEYESLSPLVSDVSDGYMEEEEDLWVGRSSANSLRDVARFHCGISVDKSKREWFSELDREGVVEKLDELLDYCAADVDVTHKVYKRVLPGFLSTCPHPVSFAALRHLSTEILPVNSGWDAYLANSEATYQRLSRGVQERLEELVHKAVALRQQPEVYEEDPWLSQLDWSGQEMRMVKGKKKGDPPRPAARQKKPGMPKWYKDLFEKADSDIALTVRTRIAPLLLRLAWDGHPLVWSDKFGFTFRVPSSDTASTTKYEKSMTECDMSEEPSNLRLSEDRGHRYFKLPHPDGPAARVASPMAKGYLQYFEQGVLGSEFAYAKEALEMNASCSYWINARARIRSQMVVRANEVNAGEQASDNVSNGEAGQGDVSSGDVSSSDDLGFILPQVVPMGTITRRAIENTWLTASNAKKNRVGSELKSMITAPPGYCFVGADVDSEELWIASLVGDAGFRLHGGGALGFMTLEGTKAAGTDLHSRTAKILGISRNNAKVFNYGRIYGAGVKFAKTLLRRFNPTLSEAEAEKIAKDLYAATKGTKANRKAIKPEGGSFWSGGTESLVFNRLEGFAQQERPRTPVLGAGITEALMKRYLPTGGRGGKGEKFMTSRINWAIQSSGVDYLHLLIVGMEHLCRRYGIDARVCLTVHDEIRYLCKEEEKYRCAMALQVANCWTRGVFALQMGIEDLPQSCAWFSAVDIDHVLRKEVDMDCVTPSHPEKIPPGESLGIEQILAKGAESALGEEAEGWERKSSGEGNGYVYAPPVMEGLRTANPMHYLRAQIAKDKAEVAAIARELTTPAPRTRKPVSTDNDFEPPSTPRTRKPPVKDEPNFDDLVANYDAKPSLRYRRQRSASWDVPAKLTYNNTPVQRYQQQQEEPWRIPSDAMKMVQFYDNPKQENRMAWEKTGLMGVGLLGQGKWARPAVVTAGSRT